MRKVQIAVWSLWAPILWLTVMALGDRSNLIDPPIECYFRGQLLYPVLSLFTACRLWPKSTESDASGALVTQGHEKRG